jgi:cytochrome c oxidase subunit 2
MIANALLAQQSFWTPPQGSEIAEKVDTVFNFIFGISLFFFTLIVVLLVVFAIKYRYRRDRKPAPSPKSHLGVEVVWTAIPFIVVIVIFAVGFSAFMDMVTPPSETYEVKVTAQKWNWMFEYPNGWVDSELHVPVDRPILLTMRSEDVIHSFYVPAFRQKMDVRPGAYSKTWFQAKQAGTFPLYCAEFCGTGHSDMTTQVIVHEPGGFKKWLREVSSLLSPRLRPQDLTDPEGILARLTAGEDAIARYVLESLRPETRAAVEAWAEGPPDEELARALTEDLNVLIEGESLYGEERFREVVLAEDTKVLLAMDPLPTGEDLQQLNRLLLSDAFPAQMTRGPDPVEAGKYIYERKGGCKACHSVDGSKMTGPTFLGVYGSEHALVGGGRVRVDENYIRESILAPQAKIVEGYGNNMPTYKGRLSDREIDYLISFIKTLK